MEKSKPRVLVIGTLDTKGEEFAFLRNEIIRRGCDCIVMDLGIMGTPLFEGDIKREEVVEKSGCSLDELRSGNKRGEAINAVIEGGTLITRELYARGEFDGIIAMGGGSGTSIGNTIMKSLPFGVPKVLVTTLTNTNPLFQFTDMVIVRTMVDLVGLNSITRTYIQHAAGVITGMVRIKPAVDTHRKSIVITCLGVTTPGVMKIRQKLLDIGKEVIVLHRRTSVVKSMVESGLVEAMLDITPNEITENMVYPVGEDNFDRLKVVREAGIPLMTSAGAMDMILHFTPAEMRPEELKDRPYVIHSPTTTLIRTTIDEQRRLGAVLGKQLSEAKGPAMVIIPMDGFSMWDCEGKAFYQPEARKAFIEGMTENAPDIPIVRVNANINDESFAVAVVEVLVKLLKGE
ncbi:Tm-1-like ATP-binding domain-containing protein [Petroclostridium sp. X23]|uniref:Tm-1-like ATP-binding domain-containing protein n=1 Tax=Petroclostridium sp. X23 TaxID=3045146 RepID=UPI0024ADF899|nr:Tm-1-like ATP-binding domain-containing protein [Petroclostridium sp. X23]WHH60915.1 Tm-1-like ATP-binding domain-containing protein [Petroclostridium sp. X23]